MHPIIYIAELEYKNVSIRCVLNVDKLRVRKALMHLNKLQYCITNNVSNVIVWLQRTHMNTRIICVCVCVFVCMYVCIY